VIEKRRKEMVNDLEHVKRELRRLADQVLEKAPGHRAQLSAKLNALKKEVSKLEVKLGEIEKVKDRHASYEPESNDNFKCPVCYVANGVTAMLTQRKGTDTHDAFHCPNCKEKFWIPET